MSKEILDNIPVMISSDLRRIYVTGAVGGYSPNEFKILLFSEEVSPYDEPINIRELKVFRVIRNELRLSPLTAKQIAKWLMKQVQEYEKNFGEIPEPNE